MRDLGKAHKIVVGHSEGKRQIGRPKNKWDNIKANLNVTEWGGVLDTCFHTTPSHSAYLHQF
jgi:hypothetical protein